MSTFLIVSTAWAVIALALLIIAWRLAHAGKIGPHRTIMILLTVGAWIFIVNYVFLQRYGGDLRSFPREYVPWMALHGSLGLIPLFGATCLIAARPTKDRNKFSVHFNRHHKRYGRTFIAIWCFTHRGGIYNAFFLP